MNQAEISRKAKIAPSLLNMILRGARPASRTVAKELAKVFPGTDRLQWLYPNEYPNPIIKQYQRDQKRKLRNKAIGETL